MPTELPVPEQTPDRDGPGSSQPNVPPSHDGGSFRIGTIAGIPIRIHITFLLLLAWIGVVGAPATGSGSGALLFVVALFGCVLLHELSHAVVAQRYKIRTLSITLYPVGGVALLETHPAPRDELWIALAGPAMNLAIAAAIAIVVKVGHFGGSVIQNGHMTGSFSSNMISANLILGLFNLIPAFPMDGGRILRALVARFTDEVRATEIAARIGQFFAIACGIFALTRGDFLLIMVAAFVYLGAGQEASATRTRSLMIGHRVAEAMQTEFKTLSTGNSLREAAAILISGSQHDFPVLSGTEIVGLLSREDLMRGMAADAENAYVAGIMNRDYPRAYDDEEMETVLGGLGRAGTFLVFRKADEGDDYLVGMLTQENAIEFLMLAQIAARHRTTG